LYDFKIVIPYIKTILASLHDKVMVIGRNKGDSVARKIRVKKYLPCAVYELS